MEKGAAQAGSIPELAQSCNVVVSLVSNDDALQAITEGPEGIVENLTKDGVHISMSTVSPALADELRALHRQHDSFYVASQIAEIARQGNYDLIFTGKETIDYNSSSVGGMVAELLGLPFISLATKFELNGTTATVTREIEGGDETVEASLPLVVSCQKGMAEARIPNMRGIMAARTKPLAVVPVANASTLTSVDSYQLSEGRKAVKMIDPNNMDELVSLLHNEAKVI